MSRIPDVLIVDDRRENLFALEQLFKGLECRLHKALDGEAALALTLSHDFALAIVDVQMPGMDGYELVEFLRANPSTSQVPVIFVSAAYADEQHLFKGYETGAVDYIVKPFEPAVLLGKVSVFLELANYRHNLESLIQERTQTITETSQLQKLVAEFSAALLNLQHKAEFDRDVEKALGRVAHALKADRVYTLLCDEEGHMEMRHEWCAMGIEANRDGLRNLDAGQFPWLTRQMVNSNCNSLDDLQSLSETSRSELRRVSPGGAQSTLLVPLHSGGAWRGLIGFDAVGRRRQWPASTHELLMLLGNALSGAVNRQRTLNALRNSEERFRAVATMNWVWETDADGHYSFSSQKVEDLLGYPAGRMIGRNHLEFITPSQQEQFLADLQRQLEAGASVIELEYQKTAQGGDCRYMQSSCIPLRDRDGRLLGLRGTDKDVTERRLAEETLAQFKTIFDTANFGAAIFDMAGNLTYSNDCFADLHGYAREDLPGTPLQNLLADTIDDTWETLLEMVRERGGIEASERLHQRRGEGAFPVLSVFTLVRDALGNPFRVATTAIDLTERKALQEQLQQAQRMESIGLLAGGIAHDFNNMLGVILGQMEIATQRLQRQDSIDSCFKEMKVAAERSVSLTWQLLTFARIQTVSPEIVDIDEVVRSMLGLLQRLIGENIELSWQSGSGVYPVRVDPAQLDQVLINLCLNARDAIVDGGQIQIETGNCRLEEHQCVEHPGCAVGDYVKLSVSDNGIGMDPDTLKHVFEPFFTTKDTGKGTGLGLATVYGAVRQNGGLVELTSTPGEGSCCTIYLPRAEGNLKDKKTSLGAPLPNGGETVLVVEDEEAYLETMAEKLRSLGYRVLTANGSEQALKVAEANKGGIDLLLTDVVMPGVNGRELAENLRASSPHMACLYMSGYPDDIISHHGVLEEDLHFLQKPISQEALAAGVREALGSWSGDPAGSADIFIPEEPMTGADEVLPRESIGDLREALEAGDMLLFEERLPPVRRVAPGIAAQLNKLADRYEFERIDEYLKTWEEAGDDR